MPKRLALQNAERWAMVAAPIMRGVAFAARPIVYVLTTSVNSIVRLLGITDSSNDSITGDDILYMANEGAESGTVEAGEAFFIQRIFEFTDRPIKAVMTPRTELTAIDADSALNDVVQMIIRSQFTRIPVFEGTLDHIIGVVHAKDVLATALKPNPARSVRGLIRRLAALPENSHVDEALLRFRVEGIHMAVVIDEYGQTAGIVTLEDLLEELVGEIRDEHDRSEGHSFIKRTDGSWIVNGLEAYDRVVKRIGLPPVSAEKQGGYTTLAGMILSHLGHIPEEGQIVSIGDFEIEIIDMDSRRIDKVIIRRIPDTESHHRESQIEPDAQ